MPRIPKANRKLAIKKETLRNLELLGHDQLARVAGGTSFLCGGGYTTTGASVGGTARCP